mgnify:CR=1 FL=1
MTTTVDSRQPALRIQQFIALTKPRVVSLIVFTAVIGMFLATPGMVPLQAFVFGTLGIGLVAGAAAAINCLVEQKIDAVMARTRARPLPMGQLTSGQTLAFSSVIGGTGLAMLYFYILHVSPWGNWIYAMGGDEESARNAGIPTSVMVAPIIPALNDMEIERILAAAAAAGARSADYVLLRLPLEIKDLFREWLDEARPDRAARVMSLVRQMRGGRDYDAEWGKRMRGEGPIADVTRRRFEIAKRRFGLDGERTALDVTQFKVPPKAGDQMDLFG